MRDSALFHIRRKANISLEHSLSVLHRHRKTPCISKGFFNEINSLRDL